MRACVFALPYVLKRAYVPIHMRIAQVLYLLVSGRESMKDRERERSNGKENESRADERTSHRVCVCVYIYVCTCVFVHGVVRYISVEYARLR